MNMTGRTSGSNVIDLNLLPRDHRPADVSPFALGAGAVVLIAVLAMVPLAFRLAAANDRADAAVHQARDGEQSLHGLQVDLAEYRGLQSELEAAQAEAAALRTQRQQMQGGARPLSEDLAAAFREDLLPPGARLRAAAGTNGGLRLEGVALGPLDAIAYADRLWKDGGFVSARMVSFVPAARGGAFVIEVTR